jgi:hypothetical protein
MKRIILVLLALMIWFAPPAYSQAKPEQILELALSNYNSVPSEIEYSTISTTEWGGEVKNCVSWIHRGGDGVNEMMFVLDSDKKKNPDGAVIISSDGFISAPVIFQKRKKIKYKSAGFDDKSNGTELNYIDLGRMPGENVENLEIFPWNEKPERDIEVKVISSIKVLPLNRQGGDYAFRVFHLGIFQEMVVVVAVGCYDDNSSLVKLQINLDFERLDFGNFVFAREKIRHIISVQTGKATFIRVIDRELGAEFGEINEAALVAGKVR